jgi:hypothetical protein
MEMTVEQQRAIALANARARAAQAEEPAKPEDPIRAQVRQEMQADRAKGMPELYGGARQAVQGATFNLADEVLAGLSTPIEMVRRGTFNPVEAYNFAKAREDLELEDARKRGGLTGTALEVGGGVLTGSGLAKAGVTFMPRAGAGLGARVGGAAADGAAMGAIAAAGDASGAERLEAGVKGGLIGGAVGGGVQASAPVVSNVAGRTLGFIDAARDPTSYAQRQVARALSESGRKPAEVVRDMRLAARDGQPFAMADSLGNPGQRLLSTVARNPGAGRTQAVEFLDGRQAGQGRRVANALAEGLDAPQTAAQTRDAMTKARNTAADANYGAARSQAGAVDPTAAIQAADDFLQPGASGVMRPQTNIADDSVEGAVRRARSYLTDGRSIVTDFSAAQRAKVELDAMIERAPGPVQRQLIQIRNALDDALAAASPPYAQARDTFRQQSRAIDAIDTGSASAQRGRSEDVVQQFGQMTPEEQGGFRVGYADRNIERIQGQAVGVNKARDFTSDAAQAELPVIAAPGQGQRLMDRLGRENTMFETRAQAMGGSRTADNLADDAAAAVNPEILSNIASGNYGTAARNLLVRSGDSLGGLTPKVREELARLLLATGKDPGLTAMVANAINADAQRRAVTQALMRGALGGSANVNARVNR